MNVKIHMVLFKTIKMNTRYIKVLQNEHIDILGVTSWTVW